MTTDTTDTVVIGAGHAGLAVSRLLTEVGCEHVVLDRGRVGERWRTERWDSLHLLTPTRMTRLPHWSYGGSDPEGFLSAAEFTRMLEGYAASFDAPVVGGTTVERLSAGADGRYLLDTDRGPRRARRVVLATGPHGLPNIRPGLATTPADVEVVHSSRYRNPAALPHGRVLVVGASASGVQIADELSRAGREVVLAVGRHTRVPRRYRGMDIFWWLESTGRLARTIDTFADSAAARREPSLQLVGRNEPALRDADLDLLALHRRGVRLTGRLGGISGGVAELGSDLRTTVGGADARMHRFLDSVDRYVESAGLSREVDAPDRPQPLVVPSAPTRIALRAEGIGTVLLATGHRPDHDWIDLPIKDSRGGIGQYRGITDAPGVYVVGQRFQHRRDSSFIDGARHDARTVVTHLLTGALPRDPDVDKESAA